MYLGSDALALAPFTQRICYLEEDDWVVLRADGAAHLQPGPARSSGRIAQTALSGALIGKGNHRHFMMKEICEQPAVIGDTLQSLRQSADARGSSCRRCRSISPHWRALTIVACGTAYLAGMVAKYWFEQLARLPVEVDIASEFRYRARADARRTAPRIVISQSGETVDTLAALRYAKSQGQKILSIVNVAREHHRARIRCACCHTLAGPEIGVASTKAFTTQLIVLACLAIAAARARGAIDATREAELSTALMEVPARSPRC